MKRIIVFSMTLLLLISAVACGGNPAMSPSPADSGYYNSSYDSMYSPEAKEENSVTADSSRKMVFRAAIDLETLEFEKALDSISQLVTSTSGYYEEQELAAYSSGYRYARLVIRVPTERFDDFCRRAGDICHVVRLNTSQENITESYYDVESRLKTAETKLERLQELLSRADNMTDIITIEDAIADTEQTIDYLSGTLRGYDSLVDYATIRIDLDEVYHFTGTGDAPLTLGQRLGESFSSGLKSIGRFFENLLLFLAYAWFWILLAATIIIILARVVRKRKFGKIKLLARKKEPGKTD